MSGATQPPAPPIEDRRTLLAIAEVTEALSCLALATLAASKDIRDARLGRARVGLDTAVHHLNRLLGNVLPPRDGPQIVRQLDPEPQPRAHPMEPLVSSQDALARLQREGEL